MEQVIQHCKEMCVDRGYIIYDETPTIIQATKPNGFRVYLCFIEQEKFNVEVVKYYYNLLRYDNIQHVIFIYKNQITPSVKKIIDGIQTMKIELFCQSAFYYNVTKHSLVPQHTRIEKEGHPEIDKYPSIRKTDPVARYYGYAVGDLIKIVRRDGSIYFRVVK